MIVVRPAAMDAQGSAVCVHVINTDTEQVVESAYARVDSRWALLSGEWSAIVPDAAQKETSDKIIEKLLLVSINPPDEINEIIEQGETNPIYIFRFGYMYALDLNVAPRNYAVGGATQQSYRYLRRLVPLDRMSEQSKLIARGLVRTDA